MVTVWNGELQLTKSEEKHSSTELDFKQRLILAEREIVHLKEEVSFSFYFSVFFSFFSCNRSNV